MKGSISSGFTVIEVVLFLVVSSALTVAIFSTITMSINEQKYRDTLTGVQSKISSQFNQTTHVVNSRDNNSGVACGSTTNRGASNCIVIGRLVEVHEDSITTSSLIATPVDDGVVVDGIPNQVANSSTADDPTTVEDYFKLYNITSDKDSSADTYQLPWEADIEGIGDGQKLMIMILRSPETGQIYTYSKQVSDGDTTYRSIIEDTNTVERTICIPRDGLGSSKSLGIKLRAKASNAGSVELLTDGEGNPC
ncbi:hypothetical protein KC952_01055 [Candidatus Saccharibacteria bacterium]|jgi:hypothetical protein|nr:hypothetical protein [Candidatus Saccharibacteria bacterium]